MIGTTKDTCPLCELDYSHASVHTVKRLLGSTTCMKSTPSSLVVGLVVVVVVVVVYLDTFAVRDRITYTIIMYLF